MLDAIARLKTGDLYDVSFQGYVKRSVNVSKVYKEFGESFVAKTHNVDDSELEELQKQGKLVVFSSLTGKEDATRYTLYNQNYEDLEACSLCEVDKYRTIFGLTDEEVKQIKAYMHAFEQIRQCCGLQMSKYEAARLNGCDMTELVKRPEYPHCELIDKQEAEFEMANSPIPHRTNDPRFNWSKPGDCARFDEVIMNGHALNGRPFKPEKDCLVS